jgi:O-antigen/teichoic acid export membrane protein
VAVLLVLGYRGFRVTVPARSLPQLLRFGAGLVPANLSSWVLDLADRYILLVFVPLSAVGVYSAGYRIGALVTVMMVQPFQNAFVPFMLRSAENREGSSLVGGLVEAYFIVGCLAASLLAAFSGPILRLLAGASFTDGSPIVGPVAFGCVLVGGVTVLAPAVLVEGKTHISGIAFAIGAVLNVGLNFALIPVLGIVGAAIATLLTYAIVFLVYFALASRLQPVPVSMRAVVPTLVVVGLVLTGGSVLAALGKGAPASDLALSGAVAATATIALNLPRFRTLWRALRPDVAAVS